MAQYRRRAIERKLIIPAGYGLVQYTLPYFDEYLKQTEDPDSAYYWGYWEQYLGINSNDDCILCKTCSTEYRYS